MTAKVKRRSSGILAYRNSACGLRIDKRLLMLRQPAGTRHAMRVGGRGVSGLPVFSHGEGERMRPKARRALPLGARAEVAGASTPP